MNLIGVVRLGQDSEFRRTSLGKGVLSFSGAYNYGIKGDDGQRPTQWVRFSMWGDRGDRLAQYLIKGSTVFVSATEARIETYGRKDGGNGVSLVATAQNVELINTGQGEKRANTTKNKNEEKSFDDMDNDIPF